MIRRGASAALGQSQLVAVDLLQGLAKYCFNYGLNVLSTGHQPKDQNKRTSAALSNNSLEEGNTAFGSSSSHWAISSRSMSFSHDAHISRRPMPGLLSSTGRSPLLAERLRLSRSKRPGRGPTSTSDLDGPRVLPMAYVFAGRAVCGTSNVASS